MVDVNLIAVFVCGIVSMILGAIWFNPKVFGTAWMVAGGKTYDQMQADMAAMKAGGKSMTKSYAINFIGALIMAYVMAHFVGLMNGGLTTFGAGASMGFWAWLGFVAVAMLGMVLWEMKSWKYYALTTGYQLVNMVVIAGILAAWR